MQSWIEDLRPRCGPLAGAAQQYLERHGIDADPPRGLLALRHLLAALRAQPPHPDEAALRTFIESAGAFLAVVLADRMGDARHVEHGGDHGLQLGRYGFFDPFEGIERALLAEDVAQSLIAVVQSAEAEAEARSGEMRVVRELSRQLASEAPELELVQRFRMQVFLGGGPQDIEVDITPLVEATRGETDATVTRTVGKIVAALAGKPAPAMPFAEARSRILPRLVGAAFLDKLAGSPAAEQLALTQLHGDVRLGYILDHGDRARFLRTAEVEAWALQDGELLLAALENLAARSARARLMRLDELSGRFVVASSGDGLDAARLLLPGLHGLLAAELGEHIAVAVPHRDMLVACDAHDARAVAGLQRRAQDESRRAPHPVSGEVFLLRPGGGLSPL